MTRRVAKKMIRSAANQGQKLGYLSSQTGHFPSYRSSREQNAQSATDALCPECRLGAGTAADRQLMGVDRPWP